MASTPDPHPDSFPAGPFDGSEQETPAGEPRRESVEGVPAPEEDAGVAIEEEGQGAMPV